MAQCARKVPRRVRPWASSYATPSCGSIPCRRRRSRSRSTSSLKDGRSAASCRRAALSLSNWLSLSRSTAACSKSSASMAASLSRRTSAISWSSSRTSGPVPTRCSRTDKRHSIEARRPRILRCQLALPPAGRAAGSGLLLDPPGRHQLDHMLADPVRINAQAVQYLGGGARALALAFADQAEQDVLGPDVVMAELECLAQSQLQRLLGPRREREVPALRAGLASPDDLLDLLARRLLSDPERLQRLGCYPAALTDEGDQDVLGADIIVVEHPGLFLGQDHDAPCPVGEPLEHAQRRLPCVGIFAVADRNTIHLVGAIHIVGLPTEVRRARFGPGLWPGPRRQARRVGRGLRRSRVGPEDRFCEAVRNDLRVPLTLEGPIRTMRGVPARSL